MHLKTARVSNAPFGFRAMLKGCAITSVFTCWMAGSNICLGGPPNVLMIVVDDMNDWVGCLGGHPNAKTPHIDRLADRGLLLANAHCPAPVCNACRVATMTGRRPGSTGVYQNKVRWHEVLPDIPTIPQQFKAHGYRTLGGGKVYHHMPGFNRMSDWHEYSKQIFDGHYHARLTRGLDVRNLKWPKGFPLNQLPSVKAYRNPPNNPREFDWGPLSKSDPETGDGKMVQWAENFLRESPQKPFFLVAGIYRPHLPFYAPQKYFDLHPQDEIQLPVVKHGDIDDLPPAGKKIAAVRREDYKLILETNKYRELLQAYLASISFADAMVGRLLDALDASGCVENTIVILWSDHGWHFGEKDHLHKLTLWERSTRIPFIVVAPGVTESGTVCRRPAGLIDLFPTLNELCGLPPVENLDGQSLVPLLAEPEREWKRPALTSHGPGNHSLRTDHWRYIRYADGGEELYDHRKDPHEWTNLADRAEFQQTKHEIAKWLPEKDASPLKTKKRKNVETQSHDLR